MQFKKELFSKQKLIVADGIAGGGKILISNLLTGLPRVDPWIADPINEQMCALLKLKKIKADTATYILKNNYNKIFYDTLLFRDSNFRKSDKSSIINHPRYKDLKGRMHSDDNKVFKKYKDKLIVHFLTHFISNYSEPIFKAFQKKLVFIRLFRSPLNISMIKHLTKWSIKWEKIKTRDGYIKIYNKKFKQNYPFFMRESAAEYMRANSYEKSIIILESVYKKKSNILNFEKKYGSKIITIPFENLILKPKFYLKKISKSLLVKMDKITSKVMKQNNVPRLFDHQLHDTAGIKFIKNKVNKKYFNKLLELNNFYHKNILNKY